MTPEQRKKYGQMTSREAQEKWMRDTEREMHKEVARECMRQSIYFLESRMDKRSTIKKGHPDFTCIKGGYVLLLELKTEHGRLSNDQMDRIDDLREAQTDVTVADTTAEAIKAIHAWLAKIRSSS